MYRLARIKSAEEDHDQSNVVCEELNAELKVIIQLVVTIESFQLQMGFSFPFLRANDLHLSLLIMRTRIFLISCT